MTNKTSNQNELKSLQKNYDELVLYLKLKLAAMGYPISYSTADEEHVKGDKTALKLVALSNNLLQNFQEKSRLLSDHLNPADKRIQGFLDDYLKDVKLAEKPQLPRKTFILDQPGMGRVSSLPLGENKFQNEYVSSYRIKQGILNNPKKDRRTTKGSFHIVEGGLPVPHDKIEVPKIAFAHFVMAACNPPKDLMTFPFTAGNDYPNVELFVSLLLRPIVCPEVKGVIPEKSMEVRFFAPGSLVSNLDFVESIFGNAGDPDICENDAALDIEHWTGHTGCIILAPHLVRMKKKDLGLPHYDYATERQRRDGMCWKEAQELYNDGQAFKLTCRNHKGVVITLIADNYYGYSKKEIKTQISYSANLYGLCEEEHAGGALVFPRKGLQETFIGDLFIKKFKTPYSFEEVKRNFADLMHLQEKNYGVDKKFSNIVYIPENATIDIYQGSIRWKYQGQEEEIKISPENHYIYPTGHKLNMEKHPHSHTWQLISTNAEGVFCHKPCTVSGGGKSEISKSISYAINYGTFHVRDIKQDFDAVDKLLNYDFKNRWKHHEKRIKPSRPIIGPERTLGSVVKLLTPSHYYADEYNKFICSIPYQVKALLFFIKMFFRKERHGNWRDFISVNTVNGREGHDLLFNRRKIMASYLRVGFDPDNSWYLHTLRPDYFPAAKIQMEDDITASIVLPSNQLENLNPEYKNKSVKIVANCEARFFQRPDEAVHRGYDVQAEADLSKQDNFITNFEPLTKKDAQELMEYAVGFDSYTTPVQNLITDFALDQNEEYFIVPSHPRIVEGRPSKNPRYLQKRYTLENSIENHMAEVGIRFSRKIPVNKPIYHTVNAILSGRRNNPSDRVAGIRPLSVYNPIHYQELPELFMDYICSLTGKSPSTTGAGSEGALTKGPFNMLTPTTDLNNALLSNILTEYHGFTTAAGHVGKENRFDHDISVIIPEIWCRLTTGDKDPNKLIAEGSLEKLDDFEYNGQKILASRLGYRINEDFLFRYFNRIFNEPQAVFSERMLKPELQDMEDFVDGINNIVEAQKKVALRYFQDGSIESAIPPLKILLHIMAHGHYENKDISDPNLRKMFDRETVLKSSWYQDRLKLKQEKDIQMCQQQIEYLEKFISEKINLDVARKMNLQNQLQIAQNNLHKYKSPKYLEELVGTIGADPLFMD